jgi:TPP-dependent pyruvate/acetoin dehydrogenase alpha subunit
MATVLKFKVETDVELKPLAVPKDRPDVKTQLTWYRHMHMATIIDDRAKFYIKKAQGWSYHAPVIGHGGIQVALGLSFRQGQDHLFPYYRDLLTCLAGGLSPYEIVLNGLSRRDDVASGGRHMSNHFAKHDINIWNVSSCTGNHTLHGVGLARANKYYGTDSIVYTSQGESSCSEGYVFEAVNGASREKLPVVFVIQNNGYGISVPVHEQTANPVVSDNFRGFKNLTIINCDGTNPFDSMNAMKKAAAVIKAGTGPVIVHAQCVRYFAHSNSDRQELYREVEELAEAARSIPWPACASTCSKPSACRWKWWRPSRPTTSPSSTTPACAPRRPPRPIRPPPPTSSIRPKCCRPSRARAGLLGSRHHAPRGHQRNAARAIPEEPRHLSLGPGRGQQGEGGRLPRHQGDAAGLRREARLQRPDRRGLHRRHRQRLQPLRRQGARGDRGRPVRRLPVAQRGAGRRT